MEERREGGRNGGSKEEKGKGKWEEWWRKGEGEKVGWEAK